MNPKLEVDYPKSYATTEDYPDEFPDVQVMTPEQAHQRAQVLELPPNLEPEEPTRSRARQLEADVLSNSLDDANNALDYAASSVELFNARRDMPQHHRRLLVALKDLIAEIETERAVFDRQERI